MSTRDLPAVLDLAPQRNTMLEDVLQSLAETPKRLPSKYFYDARGSRLFDAICELPEYYVTRTELSLMDAYVGEMAEALGPQVCLVEMGSGSGLKTRRLIEALEDPAAYVPVEISREHLLNSVGRLSEEFPELEIAPVCADFLQPLRIPRLTSQPRRYVVYFPGSTIGNLTTRGADELLCRFAGLVEAASVEAAKERSSAAESDTAESGAAEVGAADVGAAEVGGLLLGVDLQKDVSVLEAAYNDAAGLTARFNKNLLDHLNARLGTHLPTDAFVHEAPYVAEAERIEMRLRAVREVDFEIAGRRFVVAADEPIVTEYSHKYALQPLGKRLAACGWTVQKVWTDPREYFALIYCTWHTGCLTR